MKESYCFIFDLDGTITTCETLPLIGRHFHIEEEIEALTYRAIAGDVPYLENFIRRVYLLSSYPVEEIANLLDNVPLHGRLLEFISAHSSRCAIATTNLDVWIKALAKRIPCLTHCSQARINNGSIAGLERVLKKDQLVRGLQSQGMKVVFIGDGNNDMEAARVADIGIASGLTHPPASSLLHVADYVCYDEAALCQFLEQLC